MNFYEEKQARKLENYKRLADKNLAEQDSRSKHAKELADAIPFGQPMMPDHYSYKSDLAHRKKIDTNMRKSIEAGDKAEHYQNKVSNIENPYAISSDDPEAVVKIKEKILKLQEEQKKWRAVKVNKNAKSCFDEDSQNWKSVQLNSISAELRRLKKRIDHLQAIQKIDEIKLEKNGITLTVDKEENRVKLAFPGKPSEEVRRKLKGHGFHWSPYNQVWQRMLNDWAVDLAKEFLE